MSWTTPTKWISRFGDAMQLLCGGKRPPDTMIEAWFMSEDQGLQDFAAEHGPEWAQGIAVIDAARVLADQPTEILCLGGSSEDHESFPYSRGH